MTPPGPRQGGHAPAGRAPAGRAAGPSAAGPARSFHVDASGRLAKQHLAASSRQSQVRRRRVFTLLAVVTLVVAVAATFSLTGSGKAKRAAATTTTTTTTTIPAVFGVGELTENWRDTAPGVTTENFATGQTTAGRLLVTHVFYPTVASAGPSALPAVGAPAARKYGPYPVIVFAHGYDLLPSTYQPMLDAWVRAGFVVVAPVFPVDNAGNIKALGGWSNPNAQQAEDDEFHEPDDVAFVVAELDSAAGDSSSNLYGLVDAHRLALAGQSDGANVVGALVYDQAYRPVYDAMPVHPMAVAVLSGAPFDRPSSVPPDLYASPPNPPAELSSESTGDYCNPQSLALQLYSKVQGTKWFLVIDGATHLAPYTGVSPWAGPTQAVTSAFFELELGWRSPAAATKAMTAAGNTPSVTRLVSGGNGPVVPSPPAAGAPPNHIACGLAS